MANVHDMMGSFQLFQPADLAGATDLLRRYGADAWVLSGGMDTFDWLKDRAKAPSVIVDVGAIEGLRGVQATPDGVRIGALTSLTDMADHPEISGRFPLLAKAANKVATPQIRNQGSIAGNVAQDTRCWYYRSGWPCYRAGGNVCFANAPAALNREHAIFDAARCVAVTPSDTGPALVALDARIEIHHRSGSRMVPAENFFIGPSTDITRMTVLQPNEIITFIHLPSAWAGKVHYFEKISDRKSWDFALANVASAFDIEGGVIRQARIVVGGVAARPLRMRRVESYLTGRRVDETTVEEAGRLAVQGARPLQFNAFKVALTRNLVKRAIRDAAA
jgi:xanthine dehydrogenase YagS FAD-binding subunit